MKIDRLETHDRLLEFGKQADNISHGCQECISGRPPEFGQLPFYIFAHKREIALDERIGLFNQDLQLSLVNHTYIRKYSRVEQVPTARLIWEPRLTKPKAQTNSMLFKFYPEKEIVNILWLIPPQELWEQFTKGKMTENHTVFNSIHNFVNNRLKLEERDVDDLSDERIDAIYTEISINARQKKNMDKMYMNKLKQDSLEASSISLET